MQNRSQRNRLDDHEEELFESAQPLFLYTPLTPLASKHWIQKMFPRLCAGFIVYLGTLLLLSEYSNVPVWLLITARVCMWFCVSVSDFQPLQQLAVQVKKQSVCVKRKETKLSDQAEVSIHISGLTHPANESNQFVLMLLINTELKVEVSDHLCFIVKYYACCFFLWLFPNSYCHCGCFCLSLLMGRRT